MHITHLAIMDWLIIIITFALTIIVSLMSAKPSIKSIQGYVHDTGHIESASIENITLMKKPAFWATVSLVMLVLINVLLF